MKTKLRICCCILIGAAIAAPFEWKLLLEPLSYCRYEDTFDRILSLDTEQEVIRLLGEPGARCGCLEHGVEIEGTLLTWSRPWCWIYVEFDGQGRRVGQHLLRYKWPCMPGTVCFIHK